MKKSLLFRTILIVILLLILWVSNHYDLPHHDLIGYVLVVVGVLVGILGTRLDNKK